jgi:hypothetical protein
MFWTHESFLVEYIKIRKKIETSWWTFDKGKNFWYKKPLVHMLLLSVLNILKNSWNMVNFHEKLVVSTLKV